MWVDGDDTDDVDPVTILRMIIGIILQFAHIFTLNLITVL